MTLKHHPDKAGGSETKMQAINEAYEVLSTPGKLPFPSFLPCMRSSIVVSY